MQLVALFMYYVETILQERTKYKSTCNAYTVYYLQQGCKIFFECPFTFTTTVFNIRMRLIQTERTVVVLDCVFVLRKQQKVQIGSLS